MAIQSLTDLKALINSTIQDNTTNDISGSDVQTALINAIDTLDSLEGFINVHKANGQTTITAYGSKALARAAVPDDCKKEGVVIAYKISTGWLIEQNLDATAGTWGDDASWQTIGPVSVSQNTETGHTDITVGGVTTPVASLIDIGLVSILGNNDTLVTKNIEATYIEPNKEYHIQVIDWQDSNVTPSSSSYKFRLQVKEVDGETLEDLIAVTANKTVAKDYYIVIPETYTNPMFVLKGRCNAMTEGIIRITQTNNDFNAKNSDYYVRNNILSSVYFSGLKKPSFTFGSSSMNITLPEDCTMYMHSLNGGRKYSVSLGLTPQTFTISYDQELYYNISNGTLGVRASSEYVQNSISLLNYDGTGIGGVLSAYVLKNVRAQAAENQQAITDNVNVITYNNKLQLNNYITGKGDTIAEKELFGLGKDKTYRFYITAYDISGVTYDTTSTWFLIQSFDSNNQPTDVIRKYFGHVLQPYYVIEIPSDSEYIKVRVRNTNGIKFGFFLLPDYDRVIMHGYGVIGDEYPEQIKEITTVLGNTSKDNYNRFRFLHVSDTHGMSFGQADTILDVTDASFLINTGDLVLDQFSDKDRQDYKTMQIATSTVKPIFLMLGNHDYNKAPSKQDVFNAFIAPTNTHNGTTFTTTYYSVDYNSQKIKCIMLDMNDGWSDSDLPDSNPIMMTDGKISQAQINWLISELDDAIANSYHVCLFIHTAPAGIDKYKRIPDFCDRNIVGLGGGGRYCSNLDFLLEIVDCFIDGTSFNFTYNGNTFSHDFQSSGHFVAWFCGHVHSDMAGYIQGHDNQFCINVPRPYRNDDEFSGSYDGYGLGIHVNYVTVDTNVNSLSIYRIGQQETIFATPRKSYRIIYR